MRIGVDLDGVVCDYQNFLVSYINERLRKNLKIKDWTDWNFTNSGLTSQEFVQLVKHHQVAGMFAYLPEIPGALEGLEELAQDNSIHIITSRHGNARRDSLSWLTSREVKYDTISFTDNKGKIGRLLDLDYMIEDSPKYAAQMKDEWITPILYNQPWNASFKEGPVVKRVDDWEGVLGVIKDGI